MDYEKIKPGDILIYSEDDFLSEVEVLENNSTEEAWGYKLKTLKTIHKSRIFNPTPDGQINDVFKIKEGGWSGNWYLNHRN